MRRQDSLKRLIVSIEEEYSGIIRSNNMHTSTADEVGTPGSDTVDRAVQESAVELTIRSQISRVERAKEVAAAIERIKSDTYGLCVTCIEEGIPAVEAQIPIKRLKALPFAPLCKDHQVLSEASGRSTDDQSGRGNSIEWVDGVGDQKGDFMTWEELARELF